MDYRQRIIAPAFRLALPREEDAPALFHLVQQERAHLSRHLAWPETVRCEADTLATVRANRRAYAAGESAVYLVWLQERVSGVLSLNSISGSVGEIGYWLAAEMTGRGLMSRAVLALMTWYLADGRLDTFILRCGVENLPSNRVAQRLGFSFYLRQAQAEKISERWVDHNIYHWRAGRNALPQSLTS
ncbi:GCN5-related N-acetyltransferase [Candidatus Sodalis pierantonius str. SOPE]|uniref:GCN5-related N-acetyltransferase n=1 Tax=Candidatus Sodalis pierantonii str. SOPE TaxID=2342 RepID=W0HJU2_9GAMM|nr:GNAT family N-acetyltransferase [Candidatus Sodalis pierantonius]AHF74121.1 GCN5-related N-acetyltransferase [Candidatus Sodalis pierantonius str. SOPE]